MSMSARPLGWPTPTPMIGVAGLFCFLLAAPIHAQQLKQDSVVVQGRVTDSRTGAPLSPIEVRALTPGSGVVLAGAETDQKTGRYELRVVRRSDGVVLSFNSSDETEGIYARAYSGDVEDRDQAEVVSLTSSDTVVFDMALVRNPLFTGTVTDEEGRPIPRIEVFLYSDSIWESAASTDEEGRFSQYVSQRRSPYRLQFRKRYCCTVSLLEWFENATWQNAWRIPVSNGDSIALDVVIDRPPEATITGKVRDEEGNPIPEIRVTVGTRGQLSRLGTVSDSYTNEQGEYVARVEPNSSPVLVVFYDETGEFHGAYASHDESDGSGEEDHREFVLTDGTTVADVDAVLARAADAAGETAPDEDTAVDEAADEAIIAGVVTDDETDIPVQGVSVRARRADSHISAGDTEVSGHAGGYEMRIEAEPGPVELSFGGTVDDSCLVPCTDGSAQYVNFDREWYPDASDPVGAQSIELSPGDTIFINASLARTPVIRGTVRDEDGSPLPDIGWCAWSVRHERDMGCDRTDENGSYTNALVEARDGPLKFWFEDGSATYRTRWYPEADDRESAEAVALSAGDTITIDAVLARADEAAPDEAADEAAPDEGAAVDVSLDGDWVRVESNNPRNNGMRVRVESGQATVTSMPPRGSSRLRVGQVVWDDISADGSLGVRGSDGAYYTSEITMEGSDRLHIDIDLDNSPGNDQTWERAGPSIDGDWVLVASEIGANEGLRARVDDDHATLRYVPPSAPRGFRVGSLLWREIGDVNPSNTGRLEALSGGRTYSPAQFRLLEGDRLRIVSETDGSVETWARPGVATDVGTGTTEPDRAAGVENDWSSGRALVNMTTVEAVLTVEDAGDEPWMALVKFTFRLSDIVSIDLDWEPSIDPLPVGAHPRSVRGNNYMLEGETHAIDPIVSYSIHGIEPLTAFGIVPVLIEQQGRGSERDRRATAECIRDEVFDRLRNLNDFDPDYNQRSTSNVRSVARILIDRMASLDSDGGHIKDACESKMSSGETLFTPHPAYWIHAPGVSGREIREWINEVPHAGGMEVLDDTGGFELRIAASLAPRAPALYSFIGNLQVRVENE